MIPKIIHYCWYGNQPIPEIYAGYIREWKEINPGFKIIEWNEKNSPVDIPYLQKAAATKNWANMSNYVRFFALLNYGGIYMDTDMKLLKPLDSLLSNKCFFGFQEGNEDPDVFWVNNAIMGSIPNHKFIKQCADAILKNFDGTESANLSAPHIVTELLKQKRNLKKYGFQKLDDVTLFPSEVFYPIHYNEVHKTKELEKYISVDTIGVHMWGRAWWTRETMLGLIDDLKAGNIEYAQINQALQKKLALQESIQKKHPYELGNDVNHYKSQTESLKKNIEELTDKLEEANNDLEDLRGNCIKLFDYQWQQTEKINDQESALKSAEKKLMAQADQMASLGEEISKRYTIQNERDHFLLERNLELQNIKIETKELKEKCFEEIQDKNTQIAALTSEIKLSGQNNQQRLLEKEERIKQFEKNNTNLESELKRFSVEINNKGEQISSLSKEIQLLNTYKEKTEIALSEKTEIISNLKEEFKLSEYKNQEKETRIISLLSDYNQLVDQVRQLKQIINDTITQKDEIQKQKEEAQDKIEWYYTNYENQNVFGLIKIGVQKLFKSKK